MTVVFKSLPITHPKHCIFRYCENGKWYCSESNELKLCPNSEKFPDDCLLETIGVYE